MPTATRQPPKITHAKIRQWVGPAYAQRGQNYYRNGHIVDMRWRGGLLRGRVQGSEDAPYRVAISFGQGGMEGECSCPLAFNCKHVAALLYALVDAPAAAPTGPPLEQTLAGLDKAALLGLITEMLEEAPELEDLAEAFALTQKTSQDAPGGADAAATGQAARALLRRAQDRSRFPSALRGLRGLLDTGLALAQDAQWEAALAVERALLNEILLANLDQLVDPAATIELACLAAEALLRCWRALPAESAARSEALRALFDVLAWQIHSGWVLDTRGTVKKALARDAEPAERDVLREWIALAKRAGPAGPAAGPMRSGTWQGRQADGYGDADDELEYVDVASDDYFEPAWPESLEAWTQLESLFAAPARRAKPARQATGRAGRPRRPAGR